MQLGLEYRFDIRMFEEIIFFCKHKYNYNLYKKKPWLFPGGNEVQGERNRRPSRQMETSYQLFHCSGYFSFNVNSLPAFSVFHAAFDVIVSVSATHKELSHSWAIFMKLVNTELCTFSVPPPRYSILYYLNNLAGSV
jgi:hypothetical protein